MRHHQVTPTKSSKKIENCDPTKSSPHSGWAKADACEQFGAWRASCACLGSSFLNKFASKTRILETHHLDDVQKTSKTSKIVIRQNVLREPGRSGVMPVSYVKPGSPPRLASDRFLAANSTPKTHLIFEAPCRNRNSSKTHFLGHLTGTGGSAIKKATRLTCLELKRVGRTRVMIDSRPAVNRQPSSRGMRLVEKAQPVLRRAL